MIDSLLFIIRQIGGIPQPRITREKALQIAKSQCESCGIVWEDSFRISAGLKVYSMRRIEIEGGFFIKLDNQNGEIVEFAIMPM